MSGCNVKRSVFILGSFFMLPLLSFADALLMKDGKAASHIMLSPKACIVEKHAADELAIFLGKIAKGERPAILSYGKKGKGVKIHFQLVKNKKIAREGFLTKIGKKEILISAVTPVGFIYGVYDLLRKYTGIRWLTPGEDGEYFKVQKTIAIPEGSYLSNPSFPYRNISWASASVLSDKWDSYDWMMRNHLRIYDAATIFNEWKQGKAKRSLKEELAKRDAILLEGGHCFSDLLGGRIFGSKKKEDGTIAFRKRLRQMYIDHPERFPLINGKRTFLDGHKYQPCTTNKDVKRIMAHTLYRYVTEVCSRTPYGSFRLVNNDGTSWCQCAECRKIDRGSNLMVNRYWSFINELGSMVWAKKPDALLNTIAYQNYEAPPKDILPDKRFASIGLSFNRICYRHRIDDPNCLTNRGYYAKYKGWQALAEKHGYTIYTYAQIDTMGNIFMPIEHIYSHDIKVYHKMGFKGLRPQLAPPDGRFGKLYDKRSPHPRLQWYGMWQSLYLFGALSWDVDADHLKLLEEANRLYYGEKAWKAGMKDFRSLLNKAFLETPGCSGHGHSSPLGRCMDRPGTLENLRKYLAAAEKAAGSDPDKRALFHVQREKTLFNATWERFRKEYLINYREIKSYRKQGKITIDGVLNEQDWKNADTISGFKRCYGDAPIRYQTFVRVTHEPENIYFGIECMEDDMKNLVEDVKKRDGAVWENNDVEIFLTHPDLGNKYYQIIVNSIGTVFDHFVSPGSPADKKFDSQIQVGIKKLKDRWVLECRIPTAPLGEKCFDGQAWKVNILRARRVSNGKSGAARKVTNEVSTWSYGPPHDTGKFQAVNFCASRGVRYGHEEDSRLLRNGSFNEISKKRYFGGKKWPIKDGLTPVEWGPAGSSGSLAMVQDEKDKRNYYISLRGLLANHYRGKGPKVKVHVRARGEGEFRVWWIKYDDVKGRRKHKGNEVVGKTRINSPDWKNFTFIVPYPTATKVNKLTLHSIPAKGKTIQFDEVLAHDVK